MNESIDSKVIRIDFNKHIAVLVNLLTGEEAIIYEKLPEDTWTEFKEKLKDINKRNYALMVDAAVPPLIHELRQNDFDVIEIKKVI